MKDKPASNINTEAARLLLMVGEVNQMINHSEVNIYLKAFQDGIRAMQRAELKRAELQKEQEL